MGNVATPEAKSLALQLLPALEEFIDAVLREPTKDGVGKLSELSRAVFNQRSRITAKTLQVVIERRYDKELWQRKIRCPQCDRHLFRKRRVAKELSTMVGSFVLQRPYFYCSHCKLGLYPSDAIIGLAPEFHQYDIQRTVVLLAADVVYSKASEHFERMTGIKVEVDFTHQTLCRVAQRASPEDVLPSREKIAELIVQAQAGLSALPVLVATADGANGKIRAPQKGRRHKRGAGTWQDVKGFRFYLIGANGRIVQVASWHQRDDCPSTAEALSVLAKRIPLDKVRIMLIGDGAHWVWNLLRTTFPGAPEVLDRYHCKEYLKKVAKAQFDDEDDARCWVEQIMTYLHAGNDENAFDEILGLVPASTDAAEKIENCVIYLAEHIEGFDYDRRKKEGFAIGSGAMESANRYILHDRLKKCGAWWLNNHCNEMLRVRCAVFNDTFDQVFAAYVEDPPPRAPRLPSYYPTKDDESAAMAA